MNAVVLNRQLNSGVEFLVITTWQDLIRTQYIMRLQRFSQSL
jgi:hypothetical protein